MLHPSEQGARLIGKVQWLARRVGSEGNRSQLNQEVLADLNAKLEQARNELEQYVATLESNQH